MKNKLSISILLMMILILFSCSDNKMTLRKSNIDITINIINKHDDNYIINEIDNEKYKLIEVSDNFSNADYYFNFYVAENNEIYEAYFEAYGRIDKEFLYDICESLIENEKSNNYLKESLNKFILNPAGGKYNLYNDRINIDINMNVSGSIFNIYNFAYKVSTYE